MAIKAGQILHVGNSFVIDRIQTGGVSNLNIPQEKIYELGNYKTVATIRDIPDLSFEVESLDVYPEFEAIVTGVDPTTITPGQAFDFTNSKPIDIISPFKSAQGAFDIVKGIAVPYLTLEQVTYRMGNRQNATKSFTLKGDAVYYIPGTPYYAEYSGDGTTTAFTFAHTALPYSEAGETIYALSICILKADGTTQRLFVDDYTDTSSGFTCDVAPPAGSTVKVVYGSAVATNYPQTVHQGVSVKPAAVRGKDIDVYIGTDPVRVVTDGVTTSGDATLTSATAVWTSADVGASVYGTGIPAGTKVLSRTNATTIELTANASASATGVSLTIVPVMTRWTGVQSFEASRRVNLDNDEEFGNKHYVAQDYDTAEVTGSISVRSRDVADLFAKIQQITNVPSGEIVGPYTSDALPMEIRVTNPEDGSRVMTIYIEDARFTPPSVQGRVQQKLETTFNYESDGGNILVYAGARP